MGLSLRAEARAAFAIVAPAAAAAQRRGEVLAALRFAAAPIAAVAADAAEAAVAEAASGLGEFEPGAARVPADPAPLAVASSGMAPADAAAWGWLQWPEVEPWPAAPGIRARRGRGGP